MQQTIPCQRSSFSWVLLVLFLGLLCGDTPSLLAQTYDSTGASTDITAFVRTQYERLPAPNHHFRTGHVSVRAFDSQPSRRSNGFVLQLPHRGLTPGPTVAGNTLLVSGGFGSKEFYAFDARDGQLRWGVGLDDDGPTSAVVSEGKAVFNTESCTLFSLNIDDGSMAWSYWLGDPLMSTPAIANGIVYTAYPVQKTTNMAVQQHLQKENLARPAATASTGAWHPTHALIALELHTGKILWQRWLDGDILSAPVVEGKELHFTTFPGTLYQFEAENGRLISAQASRATSPPSIVGEAVYVSRRADQEETVQESISRMDRSTGALTQKQYTRAAPYLDQKVQTRSLLKSDAMAYDAGNGFGDGAPENSGWQQAASNIGQSNVSSLQAFVGSRVLPYQDRNYSVMGDELVCTDPGSGKVLWRQALAGDLSRSGGALATAPIIAGDQILIATLAGDVILYDPRKGKETARYPLGEPVRYSPVVAQGRIYVSTLNGRIHCIDTGDPRLDGWHTLGGNAAHTNRP